MSRIEDFVTQVQNPNEKQEENGLAATSYQVLLDDPILAHPPSPAPAPEAPAPAPAPPPAKKSSGPFSCCVGKKADKGNRTVAAPATTSQTSPTSRTPGQRGSVALTLSTPKNSDEGELPRDLINSPRSGGAPKATAPYRDDALLPPLSPRFKERKCLVLDLDETLVHSSFKPVDRCDFIVPVEIEGRIHQVYVAKRPYVDDFMKRMGELYEVVVFTASLAKYADPVLDLLDIHKVVHHRLFRESCSCFKGSYVKDMGRMGRDLTKIMILDNSPHSYAFNPENAVPCESWFNDYDDTELRDLISIFEQLADPAVDNVITALEKLKLSAPVSLSTDESDSGSEEEVDEEETDGETGSEEVDVEANDDD